MRHVTSLMLIAVVLLTSVSNAYSQNSTRSTLITKCEQAANEVEKSRVYISELEDQLARVNTQVEALTKAGDLANTELKAKQIEANELRTSIEALKTANVERVKEIAKMQTKINKLENKVSFWRKVALISLATGVAAGVMLARK